MIGGILFWLFCFGVMLLLAAAAGSIERTNTWSKILAVLGGFSIYWVLGSIGLHEALLFFLK